MRYYIYVMGTLRDFLCKEMDGRMAKSNENEIMMDIDRFQVRWRKPLFIVAVVSTIVCLAVQLLIYYTPALNTDLPRDIPYFTHKYIYLPAVVNLICIIVFGILLKKVKSERRKNDMICSLLTCICIVMQLSSGHYITVLCIPCVVIFTSTIFANKRTTSMITYAMFISTVISYIVSDEQVFCSRQYQLTNVIIACIMIVISYCFASIIIRFIKTQLINVAKGEETEQNLLTKMKLDPLTGLYNRTGMEGILDDMIKSNKDGNPMSLLMIDIDDFRKVNELFGRANGDEVLKRIAGKIIDMGRKDIIPSRFCDEEILILFKNHTLNDALMKAFSLLEEVRKLEFDFAPNYKITFSGGLSLFEAGMTKEEWIGVADEKLKVSKTEGKDKISV